MALVALETAGNHLHYLPCNLWGFFLELVFIQPTQKFHELRNSVYIVVHKNQPECSMMKTSRNMSLAFMEHFNPLTLWFTLS
jgi:hypothetical protein